VEVDGSACLVLGGLAVRQADGGQVLGGPGDAAVLGELDEVALDVLLGAPPQFAGGSVPDDVGGIVVAVRAQRLAEPGIPRGVAAEAGQWAAMGTPAGIAAGMAGLGLQRQWSLPAQVWRRTGREWTGPKEGAVKVANTTG
jgi:hypothetical protein